MVINDQLQQVSNALQSPWAVLILGGIVDISMRVIKTNDPKNLIYVVASAFKILADIFTKLAQLSDQVLQRTHDNSQDPKV